VTARFEQLCSAARRVRRELGVRQHRRCERDPAMECGLDRRQQAEVRAAPECGLERRDRRARVARHQLAFAELGLRRDELRRCGRRELDRLLGRGDRCLDLADRPQRRRGGLRAARCICRASELSVQARSCGEVVDRLDHAAGLEMIARAPHIRMGQPIGITGDCQRRDLV